MDPLGAEPPSRTATTMEATHIERKLRQPMLCTKATHAVLGQELNPHTREARLQETHCSAHLTQWRVHKVQTRIPVGLHKCVWLFATWFCKIKIESFANRMCRHCKTINIDRSKVVFEGLYHCQLHTMVIRHIHPAQPICGSIALIGYPLRNECQIKLQKQ